MENALLSLKGCLESKLLITLSGLATMFSSIVPEMFGPSSLLGCLRLIRWNTQHSKQHNAYKGVGENVAKHGGFACKESQVSAPMKIPANNSHNNSGAVVTTADHKSSNYQMPFCTQSLLRNIRIISRIHTFYGLQAKVSTSASHW